MTEPVPITQIEVNLSAAARKILRDPRGLTGVGALELKALAEYVLNEDQQAGTPASLAAAIALTIERHNTLVEARSVTLETPSCQYGNRHFRAALRAFETSFTALQTAFEKEFPNGTD